MTGNQHHLNLCTDKSSAGNTLNNFQNLAYHQKREVWLNACPLPCKQIVYVVNVRKFHLNNFIENSIETEEMVKMSKEAVFLRIGYDSFVIEEIVESLFYDAASFLTAVGGNLGLFLGFSCFSVLLGLIKISKKIKKAKHLTIVDM